MIEREFYGLAQLAERWGCTVSDLLHIGFQGGASICVNVHGLYRGFSIVMPEGAAQGLHPEIERRLAWIAEHADDGMFGLNYYDMRSIEAYGRFPYLLRQADKRCEDGHFLRCQFDPSIFIQVENLCVLRTDLSRLERAVLGEAASGVGSSTSDAAAPTFRSNPTRGATEPVTLMAKKSMAQLGAEARHKENREMKEKARRLYKENEGKPGYTNKTVAAQTMAGKLIAGEIGTIREWLKDPKKGQ